jgi:hypothetical protein
MKPELQVNQHTPPPGNATRHKPAAGGANSVQSLQSGKSADLDRRKRTGDS